jgi:hypothetical protein
MTKLKLESIVGSTISARKYSHAKFHAVNCGPGQPLVKVKRIEGAEKRREIVEKFVEFLMDNRIMTANGRSVSLPGVETYFVPNIKRVEAKQPLISLMIMTTTGATHMFIFFSTLYSRRIRFPECVVMTMYCWPIYISS